MFQVLPDQGEKARKTVNSRLPLAVSEVSRPTLPLATEIGFDDTGSGQGRTVGQVNRRREPPHVGGDIWIARTEPNQQIGYIAIQPTREWPVQHHDAEHAGLRHDLVGNAPFVQVRDIGLGKSHGRCYAAPWFARSVPGLIVFGAVKKRNPS